MANHPPAKNQQHLSLALIIGNSRVHWGLFIDKTLYLTGNTFHPSASIIQQLAQFPTLDNWLRVISLPGDIFPISPDYPVPVIFASVVPQQTALWQIYPYLRLITLADVPLQRMYPTDRKSVV